MKVPFFVKGLVRGGMAKSYEGKVPLDQAGAIFVKKVADFAAAPGIPLDSQPSIVLVDAGGKLLELYKGEYSEDTLAQISQAVEQYAAAE